ncbi:MAG: 50S ribosomal protein L35 [Candidatus Woesebacteria bacterium]|jgi:large subunit ribosomal protein L35
MPKLKKHSGLSKRIRITRNGKIMRLRAGDKHFNQKKSAARKRATAVNTTISGKIAKNVKQALGV